MDNLYFTAGLIGGALRETLGSRTVLMSLSVLENETGCVNMHSRLIVIAD